MGKQKVGKVTEVPPGKMLGVQVIGRYFLLVNLDGKIFAMDGKCSHMGGELWNGKLAGNVVKCPRHGSEFDVTTGKVVGQVKFPLIGKAKDMRTYPITIEGDDIVLEF